MNFSITKTTSHAIPRVPFQKIKEKVLGKRYELSIVFVSPLKMRTLNKRYRKKDASTDILSFGLSENSGELYLSMPDVAKKSKLFGMNLHEYLGYLFIHGCLHLEGMDHGRTMELLERKYCRAFRLPTPEY
jgi:probable rRNA maturation factor